MSHKRIIAKDQDLEAEVVVGYDESLNEYSLNLVNSNMYSSPIFLTQSNMESLIESLQEFVDHE